MGKNKIKEYDKENNFAIFANTMNKNNLVNMPKGGVLSGGTPIKGNGGGVTNLDGGGNASGLALPEKETVTETVATAPTGTETVTETVTESGGTASGAVSGATSGTTIATAPMISGTPLTSGAKQTFEEWAAAGGYDPDAEYGKAKNELEYAYMQNMSKFGENAERLAQMGLSGSGVSDIYQLGAYNSYLQSQNELAAQNIAAKKQLRQEYNTYSQTYDNNAKADYANAHNLGLQYYDGTNADYVRQILTNQGYDQSIIDQAMNTLSGYDINALPTIKQRAADEAAKTEAFDNAVAEGYAEVLKSGMYNGNNASEVEQRLKYLNYTPEQAAEIVKRLTEDESLGADIKNDVVNEYYSAYAQHYTPEMANRIRNELSGTRGEAYVEDIIAKLEANYNATPEEQRAGYVDMNQIRAVAESALIDADNVLQEYTGSAEQKRLIRLALDSAGYGEYVDQILEDFDSQLTAGLKPDSEGKVDVSKVSLGSISNQYANADPDTQRYLKARTRAAIEQTVSDKGSLMNAYNLVGIDKASWDQMSDWEKLSTVVDKIGYYSKTGLVDKDYFIQKAVELININFNDEDFVAYAYETGYSGNGGDSSNPTIKVDDDYLKRMSDVYGDVYDASKSDTGVVSGIKTLIDDWVSKGYIGKAEDIKGLEIYKKVSSKLAKDTAAESIKLAVNHTKEGKTDFYISAGSDSFKVNGEALSGDAASKIRNSSNFYKSTNGDKLVQDGDEWYLVHTTTGSVMKLTPGIGRDKIIKLYTGKTTDELADKLADKAKNEEEFAKAVQNIFVNEKEEKDSSASKVDFDRAKKSGTQFYVDGSKAYLPAKGIGGK